MPRPLPLLCLLLAALAGRAAAPAAGWHYAGRIDRTLAVQASLYRTATGVRGWYRYESRLESLQLDGTVARTGAATLREWAGTRRTGTLAGTFSADRRAFTGRWQSADGRRRLPCTLAAVAEYRALRATAGRGETARAVEVVYPVFLRPTPALAALNARCRRAAEADLRAARRDDPDRLAGLGGTIEIFHAGRTLASLCTEHALQGGMHPFYAYAAENYALTGAAPVPLDRAWLTAARGGGLDPARLLAQARDGARALAEADGELAFDDTIPASELECLLAPAGLTVVYPRAVGAMGGYFVPLRFADPAARALLAPLQAKLRAMGVPAGK